MPDKKRRKFDDAFKTAIVARINAGEKVRAVASEIGVVNSVVSRWVVNSKKTGRPTKPRGGDMHSKGKKKTAPMQKQGRAYPAAFRSMALQRAERLGSVKKAAEDLNMHPSNLYSWIRDAKRAAKSKQKEESAHAAAGMNGNGYTGAVKTVIAMLRGVRGKIDLSDPVHLTAMLALSTLEGKM